MCGIIGVLNGETGVNNNICAYMGEGSVVGVLRGVDSTGMLQVRKDHSVSIHKMPENGITFAQTKRAGSLFRNVDGTLATILHHRAATHGNVSYENTHPFEHETKDSYVVGVHNGTINGFNRKEDGLDFEVDSDWVYYQIAKHGAKKALENYVKGAYALVWWDGVTKTINIAANGQRELHFGFVKDKNLMLIASEAGMLYWLAKRNHMEIEKALYPGKDTIYHFNFNNLRNFKETPLEIPAVGGAAIPFVQRTRRGRTQTIATTTALDGNKFSSTEFYGIAAHDRLKAVGLDYSKEVDLYFDNAAITTLTLGADVPVEYMNGDADVGRGVLPAPGTVLKYNLSKAKMCKAKPIGVRQLYDDKKSPAGYLIIFGPPTLIETNDGEDAVEAESARGPNGSRITREEFVNLTKDGCCYCKDPIDWQDAVSGNTEWIGKAPLCQSCCLPLPSLSHEYH